MSRHARTYRSRNPDREDQSRRTSNEPAVNTDCAGASRDSRGTPSLSERNRSPVARSSPRLSCSRIDIGALGAENRREDTPMSDGIARIRANGLELAYIEAG